ncbi:MAG: transposase [Ignavibacteriae bacterium]|nr:transposase [Ignavibacteriota bacterium]MCB9243557.1 transposase [Ignavibacteriales bacterium]
MVHLPEDFEMNKEQMTVLTRELRKHDKTVLDEINAATNWYSLIKPVNEVLTRAAAGHDVDNEVVLKSMVLQEIYGLGDDIPFEVEVADRKSFQKFLGLKYGDIVPSNETLAQCRNALMQEDLYDKTFDNFFRQLLDAEVIPEQDLILQPERTEAPTIEEGDILPEDTLAEEETIMEFDHEVDEKEEVREEEAIDEEQPSVSVDDMIKEIEDRVKKLHDKKSSDEKPELSAGAESEGVESKSNELVTKLSAIDDSLQKLYKNIEVLNEKQGIKSIDDSVKEELEEKVSDLYEKVEGVEKANEEEKTSAQETIVSSIEDLKSKIDQKLQEAKDKGEQSEVGEKEDLYKKLFDSFYSQLVDADIIKDKVTAEKDEVLEETSVTSELKTTEEVTVEEKVQEEVKEEEKQGASDFVLEGRVEEETGKTIPVVMRPKQKEINLRDKKKYPIFNDANLTEDYELGLRFYKLGFKTSFVNLKTDSRYGNSRIGTGEYFPNSFWASVKQKSRWIAGIVFQNWKIYGWKGSFKTRYFLARDRKTIISFFGTALSFIVFGYFLAYMISKAMGYDFLPTIVQQNTVLWYLMMTSLLFMFTRIFHKFAFTYNWYGFRYAVMSIFRTLVDNVVNFFAIIRAVKVFRQTKDKVVWDSTEHY